MAMNIFKLVGSVYIDTQKAEESLKKTDNAAVDTGKSFLGSVGKVAKFGAAAAGMAVAVGAAINGLVESTREYRNEMAKLDTAFTTNGLSSKDAKKTYKELNGVLGDTGQAVEASNHLAKLTNDSKDLQKWTNICTGVYATFGASLPIEGLTEAANETAKVGQVTGPLADALNWAGISEDNFNQSLAACSSEQQRQKLIMETLNGVYNEAATKYKETNKDIIAANKSQDRLTAAYSKFGAVLEPVVTGAKILIAGFLEYVYPAVVATLNAIKVAWQNVGRPIFNAVVAILKNVVMPAFKLVFEKVIVPVVKTAFKTPKEAWEKNLKPALNRITQFLNSDFVEKFTKGFRRIRENVRNIMSGIVTFVKTPINSTISLVNGFIRGLNSIKVPKWVPDIGGMSANIPEIPLLAKGGNVLSGGAAIVGEEGPELLNLPRGARVTPLNKYDNAQDVTNNHVIINFYGNYGFRNREDIDYFMDEAERRIARRAVTT